MEEIKVSLVSIKSKYSLWYLKSVTFHLSVLIVTQRRMTQTTINNLCWLLITTPTTWLPNSSSNNHVVLDLASHDNSELYYGNDALRFGNGKGLPILYIGPKKFHFPQKNLLTFSKFSFIAIKKPSSCLIFFILIIMCSSYFILFFWN